jgi:hypothetical protein
MPNPREESETARPFANGAENLRVFSGSSSAASYCVACCDYPQELVESRTPKEILDICVSGFKQQAAGARLVEKEITHDGFPGREVECQDVAQRFKRGRVILAGRRSYVLTAYTPVPGTEPDECRRFFESFRISVQGKQNTAISARG